MRDTDKYYLERHEITGMMEALSTLVDIWPHLESAMVRITKFGESPHTCRAGRGDTPLPYNEAAASHMRETVTTFNAIIESVATQRQLTPPTYGHPTELFTWLKDHSIDIALCEDAPVYADDISYASRKALHLADRPKPLDLIGFCTNCDKHVYADKSVRTVRCPHCGELQDVAILRAGLYELLERSYFTRSQAAYFLKAREVPKTTRNRWIKKITPVEADGIRWFPVEELNRRVREWQQVKTAG